MAILTKTQILERIQKGEIGIKPTLDELQLKPHAIDLRLGFTFLMPKTWRIHQERPRSDEDGSFDKDRPPSFETLELEQGQFFELLPGEYVIVSTLETVKMPNDLMGVLYPALLPTAKDCLST